MQRLKFELKVRDIVEHSRPILRDVFNSLKSHIRMEWMLALNVMLGAKQAKNDTSRSLLSCSLFSTYVSKLYQVRLNTYNKTGIVAVHQSKYYAQTNCARKPH